MQVRCPHCQSPLKPVGHSSNDQTCPSCGRTIALVSAATVPRGNQRTEAPPAVPGSDAPLPADTSPFLGSFVHDTAIRDAAPENHPADQPQTLGDYDLFEVLGRGGMGVVYRARQRSANRIVALKLIRADRLADIPLDKQADALTRFRLEAQFAAQLDHAHLVTVYEVGQVEGRPFYSMKYVDGKSLYELLRDGPLENRRAARYLEAAARGVQQAHQRGIVHRDLKPHNVLIESKSDLALVTDFGLAKLAEGDSGLSLSGEVFGTPPFMSPEQAVDSSRVTALSDVYSLGATLYHAVTGRPPFQAATHVETLKQVAEQEPVSPSLLNAAVDRDLETICLKALAKEPARRYGSAQELADDLHRYLAGEPIKARPISRVARGWRWAKRNRALAGLSAALILALITGTAVSTAFGWREAQARDAAEQSAREADANAKQAEASAQQAREAVDKFYTRVSEERLLNEPGMQPLRQDLLGTALDYYRGFVARATNDKQLRFQLASAYFRMASITGAIGSKADALELQSKALEIVETMARENPAVTEYRRELAANHKNLGDLQTAIGQTEAALASYERALEIFEKLARENPATTEFQSNLATSHDSIGTLHASLGQTDKALASYERALEIFEKLARENPTLTEFQHLLARSQINLGNLQIDLDQTDEALASYERALEIFEKLTRENATVTQYQSDLAASHTSIGILHVSLGQTPEALASFGQAVEIRERLARENPAVTQYQSDLAASHNNLGNSQGDLGQTEAALASYGRALVIQEKLARENPAVIPYQSDLARYHYNLGNLQAGLGQTEAALALYRLALEIWEKLARENPAVIPYQSFLADCHWCLGVVQAGLGQTEEAQASYRRAIEINEILARENPAVTKYQSELARSHNRLGALQHNLGQTDEARASYDRAHEIFEKLARENPALAVYQNNLARSHYCLGALQATLGQMEEALASYQSAERLLAPLVEMDPGKVEMANLLTQTRQVIEQLEKDRADKPAAE